MSPESRYQRFLAPIPELSEPMVRYLTEIDHRDHEAMIALDEGPAKGSALRATSATPSGPTWPRLQ